MVTKNTYQMSNVKSVININQAQSQHVDIIVKSTVYYIFIINAHKL